MDTKSLTVWMTIMVIMASLGGFALAQGIADTTCALAEALPGNNSMMEARGQC